MKHQPIGHSRPTGPVLSLLSLLSGIILALLGGLLPAARVEAEPQHHVLGYSLDRSRVPGWVTSRALTLRIEAPGADQAWVWGDGLPAPFSHNQEDGSLLVTTEASELVVALAGADMDPALVGGYSATILMDDKAWAFSLTFDDGRGTVYQYAYPELEHYGYQAGVAVIGRWMDRLQDPVEFGYCTPEQVLELMDAGWGVYNHSYSHFDAEASITFADALSCQEAIRTKLDGHESIVFTVPYARDLWAPIIDANVESLGLRMMQLISDGELDLPPGMMAADGPLVLQSDRAFHIGRRRIDRWSFEGYNYFDQARGMAPQHAWVSLHGHELDTDRAQNPDGVEELCAVAESLSYLYHNYGPAGSDEVWMAPADQVFQYLVTRSYAVVTRRAEASVPAGVSETPWRAPEWILYSPGSPNVHEWSDTHIMEWYPATNYEPESTLRLRGGEGGRSSLLVQVRLEPPDPEALVLEARLSLYATTSASGNAMDMTLYSLDREWVPDETSWKHASEGIEWDQAGARAPTDRLSDPLDMAHSGSCSQSARWYTFDATEQVAAWIARPDQNEGLLLEGQQDIARGINFASADYYNSDLQPRLYVRYGWPMPAIPTPTITPTHQPSPTPTHLPSGTPSPTSTGARLYLPLLFVP